MARREKVAKAATAAGEAVQRLVDKVETKVLAAEGRRSVKAKARTTVKVARKAVKAGVIAGVMTAVAVVTREVRKRRKLNA
jgi:hypothetical protein